MNNAHYLKTWPVYWNAIQRGDKTFEVRKNDRDFQAGDTVYLEFYDPETQPPPYPTHSIQKLISYVLHGGQFGIEQGYVVLGLNDPKEQS